QAGRAGVEGRAEAADRGGDAVRRPRSAVPVPAVRVLVDGRGQPAHVRPGGCEAPGDRGDGGGGVGLAVRLRSLLFSAALVLLAGGGTAHAALVTQPLSFAADDGVTLHATVGGDGSLARRPLIVEDSPYAPGIDPLAGPA